LSKIDQDRYNKILRREIISEPQEVVYSEPSLDLVEKEDTTQKETVSTPDKQIIEGKVQRFEDHIDTDAIIPGEFCHLNKPEELGDRCFHHVRPDFAQKARAGANIVVAGEGWGSGSSREQAVWALKGAGIQAVIAKSYAFIHRRNLVNEALPHLIIQDDRFYELTQEDTKLQVDLSTGKVLHIASGETFTAEAPSAMIQAINQEGGIVPAIQRHGDKVFDYLTA